MSELSNIITVADDYGETIIIDDLIYERQDMDIYELTYSLDENDTIHISGITFEYDDNNIVNGDIHRIWSSTEIAIASLPENTSKVWPHPNSGDNALTFELLDKDLTYTINHSGIARIACIATTTTLGIFSVYVNNIVRAKFQVSSISTIHKSISVIVRKGDVVKVPGNVYSRIFVLPFEYPYVD